MGLDHSAQDALHNPRALRTAEPLRKKVTGGPTFQHVLCGWRVGADRAQGIEDELPILLA